MMKRFDQINVIPFIDIMLVLLAIVLTTATFISQGRLNIDTPQASSDLPMLKNEKRISIAIDEEQILYFQQKKISFLELEQRITSFDKNSLISLSIDKKTPFQRFVKIMDLLKQQNIKNISIITTKIK